MESEMEGRYEHFVFGRFRFDPSTGELWRDGHAVRIAPKPAQVLTLLLESAGELVRRSSIESTVWGDQPIDLDRSVNFAIRQIRSALGDTADSPTYIETLPRRGYRFIAPVHSPLAVADEAVESETRTDVGDVSDGAEDTPSDGSRPGRARVAALAFAVVLALSAPSIAAVIARAEEPTSAPQTIVVLPFETRDGSNADGYFAAGLSDEIITTMARLDPTRLKVIAPSSASRIQANDASDAVIARTLDARYILRGTVTPAADGIRVSVRLVDTDDGTLMWADRYLVPSPGTPALEYDIALRVADALGDRVSPAAATVGRPSAPSEPARTAYLEGRWLLGQGWDRLDDAIDRLEEAVASDSTYAPARTALARGLTWRGTREDARRHLTAATRLDPRSAAAHAALGSDAMYALWDMGRARRHFETALAVDPGNVLAHHPYAYFLSISGRHEEAISEIEEALRLDPVSPLVHGDVGRIYYRAGRFDEALDRCRATLELEADHAAALSCLINIHTLRGEPEQALTYAVRTLGPGAGAAATADALWAQAPAAAMEAYFERRLDDLHRDLAAGRDAHAQIAQALVFLGRHEEALDALDAALEDRSTVLPQVPGDPCFAVLHQYPRFRALIQEMGLEVATAPTDSTP